VHSNLDRNLDWTTELGNVYYNQPRDVMSAIQTMRERAYAAGTLKTTPQQTVLYQSSSIVIQPENPAVVYVPVYNPWIVSGAPVPVYPAYYVAPANVMCSGEHFRFQRHARCSGPKKMREQRNASRPLRSGSMLVRRLKRSVASLL
jgi:Protein of unknown function (DUF3300)